MAYPRGEGGAGGLCSLPPLFGFFSSSFYKNKFTSKKLYVALNEYKKLSQNVGNGHFRDSHFQNFLGEHAPRTPPPPPRKLAPSALVLPSPPLKVLDTARNITRPAILQPWHLCRLSFIPVRLHPGSILSIYIRLHDTGSSFIPVRPHPGSILITCICLHDMN